MTPIMGESREQKSSITAMAAHPPARCAPCSAQHPPICAACGKPLFVELDESEDLDADDTAMAGGESSDAPAARFCTVPDDVRLHCGCHFHW